MPRRSVTRFFIPLIDVLILLFCIFLLMPYVKSDEAEGPSKGPDAVAKPEISKDPASLHKEMERLSLERDRMQIERDRAVRQQIVAVLEIDGETGKLYHRGPNRIEIANQADAIALIDRQQRLAGGREVYFLILYPRELTGYPEQRQIAAFDRWFAGVPHGYNNPRGRTTGGRP